MNNKKIAIVGGGADQHPFVVAAKNSGFDTLVFDQNPECPAAGIADHFFQVSTHDFDSICAILKDFEGDLRSCFTYSSFYEAIKTTAKLNTRFGLVGLKSSALNVVTDKSIFSSALDAIGASRPRSITLHDHKRPPSFIAECHSVIVKPSKGACGSSGVSLVTEDNGDYLEKARIASEISDDGCILVEEFIRGDEYSIDGFIASESVHVILVSRKKTFGQESNFVIDGFLSDWRLTADFTMKFLKKVKEVVASTGLRDSFFSLDVIIANNDIYFIDFGCLLDAKIDLMLADLGVSVYEIPASIASGAPLNNIIPHEGFRVSCRFIYARDDAERRIFQQQKAAGNPNLSLHRFQEAEANTPPESVADSLGVVIARDVSCDFLWSTSWTMDLVLAK